MTSTSYCSLRGWRKTANLVVTWVSANGNSASTPMSTDQQPLGVRQDRDSEENRSSPCGRPSRPSTGGDNDLLVTLARTLRARWSPAAQACPLAQPAAGSASNAPG